MLSRLSDHIQACYERAAEAERCAQSEPAHQSYHLDMAKRWAFLARSYEFLESSERLLLAMDGSAPNKRRLDQQRDWQPIATAPFDRDLRLAVIDQQGIAHALVFPCRRVLGGWLKAETKARIDLDPTHWQEWIESG
jgi:hypothetical protein